MVAKRLIGDAPLATKLNGGEAPHRRRFTDQQAQFWRSALQATHHWPPGSMEATRHTGDAPLATKPSGGEAPHRRRSTGHQAQCRRSVSQATLHWPPGSIRRSATPATLHCHWPLGSVEAKRLTGDAPLATTPSGAKRHTGDAPLATRLSGSETPHRQCFTDHQGTVCVRA